MGSGRATVEVRRLSPGVVVDSVTAERHDDLTEASSSHAVEEEVDGMIDENEQVTNSFRYLHAHAQ